MHLLRAVSRDRGYRPALQSRSNDLFRRPRAFAKSIRGDRPALSPYTQATVGGDEEILQWSWTILRIPSLASDWYAIAFDP